MNEQEKDLWMMFQLFLDHLKIINCNLSSITGIMMDNQVIRQREFKELEKDVMQVMTEYLKKGWLENEKDR